MLSNPVAHEPVDVPLCSKCRQLEMDFFDPGCPSCADILRNPETTVAQIFAIMRQWVPQTQLHIDTLVNEMIRRGVGINDRDKLTGMTMLHFASKAGAKGVGDGFTAQRAVEKLLSFRADPSQRCSWTQMNALHYAAYFDVAPVVRLMLEFKCPGLDVNARCPDYDNGTALHLAASNLCSEVAKLLLESGADNRAKNDQGKTPVDCVPDVSAFPDIPHIHDAIIEMQEILACNEKAEHLTKSHKNIPIELTAGRALLMSMGLHAGSRVIVGGEKYGTLQYCGTTEFALGLWAGVELETPDGKNDGSVKGVVYFRCRPGYGIFVPINKISRFESNLTLTRRPSIRMPRNFHYRTPDLSKVSSKVETGLSTLKSPTKKLETNKLPPVLGEKVKIVGHRTGTARYCGETKFAPGIWCGIELDNPEGKHDGIVEGVRYFSCYPNHGVMVPLSHVIRVLSSSSDAECAHRMESSQEDSNQSAEFGQESYSRTPSPKTLSQSSTPELSRTSDNNPSPIRNTPTRRSFRNMAPIHSSKLNPSYTASPVTQRKPAMQLTDGVHVLANNEFGIVRYVGPVDFADGTWVGVELQNPKGKNDGCVKGRRYFHCKPSYGLLVRPDKISIRGINGAMLLKEDRVGIPNSR